MTIRIGVAGVGVMGRVHLRAWRDAEAAGHPCEVVAVADLDPARLAGDGEGGNLAAQHGKPVDLGGVRTHASADELIADDGVDVVDLCVPTPGHVPLAEAAMRRGRHVLVEKPVALTAEPVRRLAGVARECGVSCMPALCMRFWPAWRRLIDAHRTGEFGPLRSAHFVRLGGRPTWSDFYTDPALCGGAMIDLHVHDADFIVALLGPPLGVTSAGTIDHVTTIYHHADVPHVVAQGGWLAEPGGFTMRYRAEFEAGTLDFDLGRDPPLRLRRGGRAEAVEVGPLTGYDAEVRHLADALAAGRTPDVTLDDAAVTHAVLDAERESLETGRRVDL